MGGGETVCPWCTCWDDLRGDEGGLVVSCRRLCSCCGRVGSPRGETKFLLEVCSWCTCCEVVSCPVDVGGCCDGDELVVSG